jgi:hypothetical protein
VRSLPPRRTIGRRLRPPRPATDQEPDVKRRTAEQERRRATVWFVAAAIFLVAMLGMWWLVEETNEEGTHDAELLPFFALIPVAIGAYHLVRSRLHHA